MTFVLIVLSSFFSVLISVLLTLRLSKKNQQFDEAKIIQTIENKNENLHRIRPRRFSIKI